MSIATRSRAHAGAPVIGAPLAGRAIPQSRPIEVFDDFYTLPKGSSAYTGGWFESDSGGGSILLQDLAGGVVRLRLTGGAGQEDSQEGLASPGEFFSFDSGKEAYFEVHVNVNTNGLTGRALWLGMTEGFAQGNNNTTILAPLAHMGFSILGADLSFSHAGSTVVTTDLGVNLVADTDYVLACHYNGDGAYLVYVNGELKLREQTGGTAHPDALMRIFLSAENPSDSTSGNGDMLIDCVYFCAEG